MSERVHDYYGDAEKPGLNWWHNWGTETAYPTDRYVVNETEWGLYSQADYEAWL